MDGAGAVVVVVTESEVVAVVSLSFPVSQAVTPNASQSAQNNKIFFSMVFSGEVVERLKGTSSIVNLLKLSDYLLTELSQPFIF